MAWTVRQEGRGQNGKLWLWSENNEKKKSECHEPICRPLHRQNVIPIGARESTSGKFLMKMGFLAFALGQCCKK